ncbi:MAG: LysR family transcriptional regulator [Paracoccaceae bacterium]|nr:MAG: LysR family transcriptional regulator [Paracoccaceae bacterium]
MGRSKIVGALPRMPLEVLRYVVLIGEQGSTFAAAQMVNLTSSSLSRKIAQLEHELGLALFERHSRGMRPTDAGQLVIEAARHVIARMERLASEIDDGDAMNRGFVRVFASQALVEHILMPRVLQLGAKYPNVKIELNVAAGRQAERALVEDVADFALIITVPTHPDIDIVAERRNHVVAVVRRDHPFAGRTSVDPAEVVATAFAALPGTYSSRQAFNSLLPDAMKSVQPQMTANSVAALKAYAQSGLGVAVVPELTVWDDPAHADLVVVPLEGAERTDTRMCLCRRRTRIMGSAARNLLAELAASFDEMPLP